MDEINCRVVIKRTFGEQVTAKKFPCIVKEPKGSAE